MRKRTIQGLGLLALAGAALLVPLPLPPARIHNAVQIERAPADVFNYVTTPANWPRWHPSSLAVQGDAGHPLALGEQVTEDFLVAGHRGRVTWTVAERAAPTAWSIDGKISGGGAGRVSYRLAASGAGTAFEREFVYQRPNLLFWLADEASLRGQVEAESAEALRRLKAVLEQPTF
ncbi:MAG: SRPBCC family protein [Pseudomonadota bacterium]